MPSYSTCGLIVHSEIALPELVNVIDKTDNVHIKLGGLSTVQATHSSEFDLHCDKDEVYFYWDYIGSYTVRGGEELLVHAKSGVEPSLVRVPLLGVVLATLLHRRGLLVLHGSAVSTDEGAVVFMGEKGMGKSTTAAALQQRGHAHVTDDIVAVDMKDPAHPLVYPTFPQMKLWPDAALSLGQDPEVMPLVMEGITKRAHQITEKFSLEPLPLKRIYALSLGERFEIKPLSVQESLAQIIAHSYCSRFGRQLLQGEEGVRHFRNCAHLASCAPLAELQRKVALDELSQVAQAVEADVRR